MAEKELTVEQKLRTLYDLQLIDSRIDQIRAIQGELPLEVRELEDEIEGLSTRLSRLVEENKNFEEQVKKLKNTIVESKELITRYEAQQKNVRNNREYDSISKEIEYQNLEIEHAEKLIGESGAKLDLQKARIAETKEKLPRLAGPQRHMELHRADRRPAVDDRIGAAAVLDRFGQRRRAVEADKGVARGIEAVIRAVRPEHGIVIPPLAVFGFVINGVRLQLDLADGEVPLEVGAVVHRVPEAELYIGEHIERLFRGSPIFQRQPDEQAVVALRDQQRLCGRNTIFLPLNHAVAEAVAAGIAVQLRFRGLPAGVPDGIAVFDVNMEALLIDRAVIVAVAGQPAQPRVAIEAVAARRIRQECEKILAPQVVDPRQRRARACDHVLAPLIVKETKLHLRTPPSPEDPCVPAESKSIKCLI